MCINIEVPHIENLREKKPRQGSTNRCLEEFRSPDEVGKRQAHTESGDSSTHRSFAEPLNSQQSRQPWCLTQGGRGSGSLHRDLSLRLLCGVVWMCYNLWADGDGRGTANGRGRRNRIVPSFFPRLDFPYGKPFGVLPGVFSRA